MKTKNGFYHINYRNSLNEILNNNKNKNKKYFIQDETKNSYKFVKNKNMLEINLDSFINIKKSNHIKMKKKIKNDKINKKNYNSFIIKNKRNNNSTSKIIKKLNFNKSNNFKILNKNKYNFNLNDIYKKKRSNFLNKILKNFNK